jgi:hypothetical protein
MLLCLTVVLELVFQGSPDVSSGVCVCHFAHCLLVKAKSERAATQTHAC